MNYKILDSRNDSKNATRYDALISIGANEEAPKKGFWDTLWNGPDKEKPTENQPEIERYAMRITSQQKGIDLNDLLKEIVAKKPKWKYNDMKNIWSVQLPLFEGFAIIKPYVNDMPLADYFKPKKKSEKPNPHLL